MSFRIPMHAFLAATIPELLIYQAAIKQNATKAVAPTSARTPDLVFRVISARDLNGLMWVSLSE